MILNAHEWINCYQTSWWFPENFLLMWIFVWQSYFVFCFCTIHWGMIRCPLSVIQDFFHTFIISHFVSIKTWGQQVFLKLFFFEVKDQQVKVHCTVPTIANLARCRLRLFTHPFACVWTLSEQMPCIVHTNG